MKLTTKILFLIVLFAAVLRLYKIDQIPPSLSWDEADVGYNAFTIANWDKDEWGRTFPFYFKSFEDDKHPVHIYFTALSVKIFGLSEFSTRLPSALFGIFNVVVIFYLAKIIFKSITVGFIAAIFLAISPYAIQFSRFNHEANFALFFWMFGLLMFLWGIKRKKILLPVSIVSFGISLLSYHSSKIVLPPLILLLFIFNFKDLIRVKKFFFLSLLILITFILIFISNPALLGIARVKQTSINYDRITKTSLYQKTNNELLGKIEVTFNQYLMHLTPQYLFLTGSSNKKFSTQITGEFYKVDLIFLILGFFGLIWEAIKRPDQRKMLFVLLAWIFLAPLPASLVEEAPHAARALFMMGSWHLVAAFGFYKIVNLFKKTTFKIVTAVIFLIPLVMLFITYLDDYYTDYANKYSIDWQYGMKQVAEYVQDHNGYSRVYTTDIRFQPYIFFLYYLKTPLPHFLDTVVYNDDVEKRKYNLVSSFDNYHFGDWDPIESQLNPGVLYAVTASQYDGLKNRENFSVKKRIRYLDNSDAFYLVSYP